MVSDSAERRGGSRRELLAASVAGAGALVAGCGGSAKRRPQPRPVSTVAPADVAILNGLLDLENYTIAAYTAGIPLMRRRQAKVAAAFLGQEQAHAGSLTVLIKRAHARPNKRRASYDLGHPSNGDQVLALLHRLESLQLSAYAQMIPRLSQGHLRSAAAAIFANDAQHIAMIRSQLGLAPVPSAFATGGE